MPLYKKLIHKKQPVGWLEIEETVVLGLVLCSKRAKKLIKSNVEDVIEPFIPELQ